MVELTFVPAGPDSVGLLARFNRELMSEQDIPSNMTLPELESRMHQLLAEGFSAILFQLDGAFAGYALFRRHPKYAYIRHFHITRPKRTRAVVVDAFQRLRTEHLSDYATIRLDVPEHKKDTLAMWEELGFRPRSIRLELHTDTKRKTKKSCGAIIYRKRLGHVQYLVIQHTNGGHWGFPKGHPEAGETERETALREVHEETGLHVGFRPRFYERIYYLTGKGRRKEVVYFLARVRRPRVRLQPSELSAYQWLDFWETRETLTYENTKLLLDKAANYIANHP
jgi:bis(5'-nucleosidyl)-tetraphosphatase